MKLQTIITRCVLGLGLALGLAGSALAAGPTNSLAINPAYTMNEDGTLAITFKCDAGHTWMRGFLLVLDHRFHAVSDSAGLFRIPAVPPGTYRLKAWHEKLGTRDAAVTVKAGEEAKVRIEFK